MMRRAARCVAGATAACAALTYAQACALHAAYSPLPGATDAPTEGIARGGDARRERRSTGGGGGGGDRTAGGGARRRWDDLERGSIRDRRRDARRAATATTTRRRETRRVIVLGDSLVTGVGCSVASAARGPVLPRIIAERLASLLGVDVEWVALGVGGADVDTIRREVLPELERKVTQLRRLSNLNLNATDERGGGGGGGGGVDAVVLMCGVNDFKMAFFGRTALSFRRQLRETVREIERVVGPECVVVLPGMPMDLATLFPPPLSYVAIAASEVWDTQKRRLHLMRDDDDDDDGGDDVLKERRSPRERGRMGTSHDDDDGGDDDRNQKNRENQKNRKNQTNRESRGGRVLFVSKPAIRWMRATAGRDDLTARDGIHPNEWGYDAWARHIAESVSPALGGPARCEAAGGGGGGGGGVGWEN